MRVCVPDGVRLPYVRDICYEYSAPETGELIRFRSDEILHFKSSMTFSGLFGISVRDKLRLSLDGANESQKVLNELYKNNMAGRAVVQFSPTQEMKEGYQERYVKQLDDFAHGRKKTGSTFIPIPYGTSVTPLNLRLADEQFLELRKYTALQIASAFGIKPNQLNDYEKASYANSEAQQLAFYVETMLSILKQYEEELNYKLLSSSQIAQGYRFKFNVAAVLRGDTKAQVESLCQGIAGGLYTPNEARRMLDLPSKEGGDRIFFNGSNIAVEDAGIQYQALPEVSEENSNEKAFLYLAKTIESAIMSLKGKDNYLQDPTTGQMMGSTGGGGSSGGENCDTAQDNGSKNTTITDEIIASVPRVNVFDDEEKNARYQQANKDLLKEAQKHPVGTEVSRVYDADMKPIEGCGYKVGEKLGQVKIDNPDVPYHAFHNHPSGETLSPDDILGITNHSDMQSISAIGNNGNTYCMIKGTKANSSGYRRYIINRCQQKRFLGEYSYFEVSSTTFDSSSLSDLDRSKLKSQLISFNESCAKGGIFYGFSYRRQ
jgi:HK97 family phage portal protein